MSGRRRVRSWMDWALTLALALGAAGSGCNGSANSFGAPSGRLGATPGGAQDIGFSRRQIESGSVPRATDLTVEGMLSEHDLPLEGAPCTEALCLQAALVKANADDDGRTAAWVQLGFSSGLSAETFRRAELNLSVVVDR